MGCTLYREYNVFVVQRSGYSVCHNDFFSPNKITMPLTKAVEYCSRTYQARAKNASVLLVLFGESVLFLSFVRFSYQLVQLSAYLYIE